MAGEEPPYLAVGTDVSAKYKGAFCEAKVKKVIRSVKCKVTFKNNLGSVTVPDDHVKGTLRANAHVEVRHPEKNQFFEAIINKLHDHSQYTVVFDDGDETTLRRTSLCLKSGRHFAESETLDQLPLTHPEHFGTPVMGSKGRKRRSLNRTIRDEGSSDEDMSPPKKKEAKLREPDPDIGKVVCVEVGEKKKSKDNWFPALVVSPSAQDSLKIAQKEEYLVRSFKDGKYYCVCKRETREFTREIGSKVDNNTLKTAVEKAQLYNDRDELPPHWDREVLFRDVSSDEGDSNDDSDSETSDDEPSEEKDRFVAQLYKFMDDRGTPINKAPTVGNRDLSLCKLFKVVQKLGGYNRVTNHMQWKTVYTKMGLPGYNTSSSHQIKQAYKKYLHSFENFYRKLGCTMGTSTRAGRMRHRTGRNIMLTRDRDREFRVAGRKSQKQENKSKKKDEKSTKEDEESDKTKDDDDDESKEKDREDEDAKDEDAGEKEKEKPRTKDEKKLKKKERSLEKKKVDKDEKVNRIKSRRKPIRDDGSEDKNQDTTDDGEFCSDIDINVGDKVRVKYGRGRQQKIYEAKVLELEEESGEKHFYVHYTGWNMRYDEWVKRHRIVENLSLKVRKGRSAGFPKNLPVKVPAKRGRPPIGAGKSPTSRKIGPPTMSSRSRATRSDKNSLNDSPFVNGLEPQRRPRIKSGHTPRSKDSGDESTSDEMDDSGSSSERKKERNLSDEMKDDDDDDEGNKSDEEDNAADKDEEKMEEKESVKKKRKRKDDLDTSLEENEDEGKIGRSKMKSKKGKGQDVSKPKRRGRKPKAASEDDESLGRSDDEAEKDGKRRGDDGKMKSEESEEEQKAADDVSKVKRRGRRKSKKKIGDEIGDDENDADDEAAKPTTDEEKDIEKKLDDGKVESEKEKEGLIEEGKENLMEVCEGKVEEDAKIAAEVPIIQVEPCEIRPVENVAEVKICERLSPVLEAACREPVKLVSLMPDLSSFGNENKLIQPNLRESAFDLLRKEGSGSDRGFAGEFSKDEEISDKEVDADLEQLAKKVKRKSKLKDEEEEEQSDDDLHVDKVDLPLAKPKLDDGIKKEEEKIIFTGFVGVRTEKVEQAFEEPLEVVAVNPPIFRHFEIPEKSEREPVEEVTVAAIVQENTIENVKNIEEIESNVSEAEKLAEITPKSEEVEIAKAKESTKRGKICKREDGDNEEFKKKVKEGKVKKSKEKKSKQVKDGEKVKKKEGRKRKDDKWKKAIDSDMESMESNEVRKKEKKSRKSKQDDKRRDGEPAKKKSKKKVCKEGEEDLKKSRKSEKVGKIGKKKKKKGSCSDDQEVGKKIEKGKARDTAMPQLSISEEVDKMENEEELVNSLLLCQEDVPMSPVGIDVHVSKQEIIHNIPFEMKSSLPIIFPSSSSSSTVSSSVKDSRELSGLRFPTYSKPEGECSTVLDNTPPTTPESADSMLSESILHDHDSRSVSRDEDSTKSGQESQSFNAEMEYGDVSRLVCHESVDFGQSEAAMVLGSMGVQVYEKSSGVMDIVGSGAKRMCRDVDDSMAVATPSKKKKKSRRRSHSASDVGKGIGSSAHYRHSACKQTSDSDDAIAAEQSSFFHPLGQSTSSLGSGSGSCTGSDRETLIIPSTVLPRSPRSSKFNFFVELDDYSNGAERIAVLQEKLSELRKTYMALKAEVACIDRRRKKLRRKEKEATAIITSTAEVECS